MAEIREFIDVGDGTVEVTDRPLIPQELEIERIARGRWQVSYYPGSGFTVAWTTLCITDWGAKRSIRAWLRKEQRGGVEITPIDLELEGPSLDNVIQEGLVDGYRR